MNEIVLEGCTPTPLVNYLKGLGVLRLLASARSETTVSWRDDCMILSSDWSGDEAESFFLRLYKPTPILAPWNGGSGFYNKDNKAALIAILNSSTPRLELYRECIRLSEEALSSNDRDASPKDTEKLALLARLRGSLPDAALDWFDAAVLLAGSAVQYPPLLGTGGNDGRLDFTNNFMQRLTDVLSMHDEDPPTESRDWLKMALFGVTAPGLVKKAIGQFHPGQVGGPNSTTGFEADSAVNPWDYILMIEGALPFAAAAVRRNAGDPDGILSYPFTVRSVGAGAGNLGEGDANSARGELWMPLWKRPASYPEVKSLLSEGRVALGRKPVRDALDFVRAVHRFGSYRGIDRFQRYGLLMRSGKAYLATPLARVNVSRSPRAQWIDELDEGGSNWLARFRRFAQGDVVAKRFLGLRRQLEDAIFELAGSDGEPSNVQSLIALLGRIEAALAVSRRAQEIVPPIPVLSENWVRAADDGTPAFRIACALAGLRGSREFALPLRAHVFPLHPRLNEWMTPEARGKLVGNAEASIRLHLNSKADLISNLVEVLRLRLRAAERIDASDKLLRSSFHVDSDDLVAFLNNDHMDRRIADLLPGLSLCRIPQEGERSAGEAVVPAAFAILKLCVTPSSVLRDLALLSRDQHVPVVPEIVAHLASGNAQQAVRIAWRRLRTSGLSPLFSWNALPELNPIDPRRAAAALLIPMRFGSVGALGRSALKELQPEST